MPATQWTEPGARRRKITIQQQSTTSKTALGFLTNTWTDVLTTWAKVTPKQAPRLVIALSGAEPIIRNVYEVNIRYAPSTAILPGMRVVEADGGAVYVIQTVADLEERHREWVLICSQVPAPAAQDQ